MDSCNPNYEDAFWSYYRYAPSIGGNVAFVVLFGLSTTLHVVQMWKTRTWYLTAFIVGCYSMSLLPLSDIIWFETIGYIGRVLSAKENPGCWTMGPFVIQNLLILVEPAFMAASIRIILGRIILLTEGEQFVLVKQRWLTKLFVCGDVLSIFLQGAGGGMMARGATLLEAGEHVIIGGLFVQLVVFGGFLIVAGIFHYRMQRQPTVKATDCRIQWRTYLLTLYVTGMIIWARSLFRVVEFLEGNDGHLMRSEGWVFGFDSVPMVVVVLWMNWFHPGEIGLLYVGRDRSGVGWSC